MLGLRRYSGHSFDVWCGAVEDFACDLMLVFAPVGAEFLDRCACSGAQVVGLPEGARGAELREMIADILAAFDVDPERKGMRHIAFCSAVTQSESLNFWGLLKDGIAGEPSFGLLPLPRRFTWIAADLSEYAQLQAELAETFL